MSRIAIIDLGTNTFNLLIAELSPEHTYKILYKNKVVSKLGEGGINIGLILPVPFQRGIDALKTLQSFIRLYEVETTYAYATSAIRSAQNADEFIITAEKETGIRIEVISGDREAELIYFGVRAAVELYDTPSLIMDIGGGSAEFIIANKDLILWKKSFPLGAARLLERFHESDPIAPVEKEELTRYLLAELAPLTEAVEKHPVTELIGASGSFDSLAEILSHKYDSVGMLSNKTEYTFNLKDSNLVFHEIIRSSRQERLSMKGLIEMRVDMMVVSAIFIHLIILHLNLPKMRLSTYSLKEGALWELVHPSLAES